jgi:hypothetical protein
MCGSAGCAAGIEASADHPPISSLKDPAQDAAVLDDSEPVPMSLDRDASDRTFDRQLAYLGMLDDAAVSAAPDLPRWLAGSRCRCAAALPCLIDSALLLRIARKLYGGIGPAFYGLRTTLLTLLLMALLRIQRPEHLKERDPAAFGRLLGLDGRPRSRSCGVCSPASLHIIRPSCWAQSWRGFESSNAGI